jgi:hypothetical protein
MATSFEAAKTLALLASRLKSAPAAARRALTHGQ